ncbi:MAG: TAXI family TRAP transporter solute-binding subunit, partial [Rhodospirillales bacterium]|nr:TAXI family TRAP transporter solute-binding subunit [Rhodospirillales bacterium]
SGMAVAGTAPYKKRMQNVRLIARVWILPYAYMVKESSGIKTLADLKGKKVVVKFKTNVSLAQTNRTILATAGLTVKDVQAVDSGGVVAGINMVVEGRAVTTTVALAMPAMRKTHATVPGGLRILPLGPKATNEFLEKGIAGLYTMKAKPGKRTPFVRAPITIAAFDTYLNAGSQVDAKDAYALAKTVHTNWKAMQKAYGPLRGTPIKGLATPLNVMPYHPGAVKYYKEAGLWTDANTAQQKKVMARVR